MLLFTYLLGVALALQTLRLTRQGEKAAEGQRV